MKTVVIYNKNIWVTFLAQSRVKLHNTTQLVVARNVTRPHVGKIIIVNLCKDSDFESFVPMKRPLR